MVGPRAVAAPPVFRSDAPELLAGDEDVARLSRQTSPSPSCSPSRPPDWAAADGSTRDATRPDPLPPARRARRATPTDDAAARDAGVDADAARLRVLRAGRELRLRAPATTTVSRAAGERVLLPGVRDADADAVVLADGFSCRTQIEQGDTGRTAVASRRAAGRRPRRPPARRPARTCDRRATRRTRTPTEEPPMSQTVADYVLERLRDWGVELRLRLRRRRHQRAARRMAEGRRPADRSSRPGTRRWPPSRPSATPSSAAGSASAPRPAAQARSTCSTASTTPSSTTCRSSRSSARPTGPRWAATTSRRSTCCQPLQGRRRRVLPDGHRPRAAAQRARPRDPHRRRASAP